MKYLRLKSNNPYYNLALEEYLFSNTDEDIFMLWQNAPTVVVGRNQNVYAEVNLDFVKSHNVLVSRRITGGGAVYQACFDETGRYIFYMVMGKVNGFRMDILIVTDGIVNGRAEYTVLRVDINRSKSRNFQHVCNRPLAC